MDRLAIKYQLQSHGPNPTIEDAQILENKRICLQKMIDMFAHQSDAFILNHELAEDVSTLPLGDYLEYDCADDIDDSGVPGHSDRAGSNHPHNTKVTYAPGGNAEDIPLLLPSSLGWDWCI